MRIKPYVILGLAALCALAALATVVMTSEPSTAEPAMRALFWVSLTLSVWSVVATLFSLAGQRLATALSNGLVWAAGLMILAALAHHGISSKRLSAGIILATILISSILWIRSKRYARKH